MWGTPVRNQWSRLQAAHCAFTYMRESVHRHDPTGGREITTILST